jgi:hypothetical protein
MGRSVVDLLVKQRFAAVGVFGAGHGGMVGEAVRRRCCLLVPVESLCDQSGPEVDEAVV